MDYRKKIIIVNEGINGLHSFDSFFKINVIKEALMIISFLNIGISNHPLNNSPKIKFIDRSRLLVRNIHYLKINHEILVNSESNFDSYYLGGYNILARRHNEIEIKAETIELELPGDYRLSTSDWLTLEDLDNHNRDDLLSFFCLELQ